MCLYHTHTATKEIITVIPGLVPALCCRGLQGHKVALSVQMSFLIPKAHLLFGPNTFVDCRQQHGLDALKVELPALQTFHDPPQNLSAISTFPSPARNL